MKTSEKIKLLKDFQGHYNKKTLSSSKIFDYEIDDFISFAKNQEGQESSEQLPYLHERTQSGHYPDQPHYCLDCGVEL